MDKKVSPLVPAAFSALVWGSGQVFNRQYIKGVVFFLAQCLMVGIELFTGNYFNGVHLTRASGEFFVNGGLFLKGAWGLVTLGTQAKTQDMLGRIIEGDHSILLMMNGIIGVLVLALFLAFWIWNISDARRTRDKFNKTGRTLSTRAYIQELWDSLFHYIVLLPAIIALIFITIMPMMSSLLIAFTNYSKANMPPTSLVKWVGFKNFKDVLTISQFSGTFFRVFGWTLIWAIISTTTCFFGGFFQAVIVNSRRVKFKKFWRTVYILPWAIPGMVSLLVFRLLFHTEGGPISQFFVDALHFTHKINWLNDSTNPNLARLTIIVVNLWLGFPYFMSLMTGVMTGLSEEIFEAARIDGANSGQEFRKITFPIVMQATTPLLIMSFAGNFNNFGVIYFFTGGGPTNVNNFVAGYTDILISWIYKLTLDQQLYNMASVLSILIFLIVGTISIFNLRNTRAFKEDAKS